MTSGMGILRHFSHSVRVDVSAHFAAFFCTLHSNQMHVETRLDRHAFL